MEYYQFYRLDGPPFQPASPNSVVYFSPAHLQALTTLESGLENDLSGLTLLTGEAGTGKTTLIYSLLKRDYKRVRIAHIEDPKLSFEEIMKSILAQMNLYSAGATKLDYLNTLDHLLELHGEKERIAVVVDEAQLMTDDVLEELRLLSNRGQRSGQYLQLILVGQPELAERLKKPELRQLNQRISSRGVLKPLTLEQGMLYVECRLNAQGGKYSAIFDPGALKHLLARSDGIPRKINMLCHSAMQAGFHGLEKRVTVRTAKKVAAEYHESVRLTKSRFKVRRMLAPAIIGGAAFASVLVFGFTYLGLRSDWSSGRVAASTLVAKPRARQAAAVKDVKPAANPIPDAHPDPRVIINAAPPALHPVGLSTSPATVLAAPAAVVITAAPVVATAPVNAAAGSSPPSSINAAPAAPGAPVKVAAVEKKPVVSLASAQTSHITVRSGDTLEKIAIRYLGSIYGLHALVAVNPQLTNVNQLSVGQIINLPRGPMPTVSHE